MCDKGRLIRVPCCALAAFKHNASGFERFALKLKFAAPASVCVHYFIRQFTRQADFGRHHFFNQNIVVAFVFKPCKACDNIAVGICNIMKLNQKRINAVLKSDYKLVFILHRRLEFQNTVTAVVEISAFYGAVPIHLAAERSIFRHGVIHIGMI